MATQPNVYEYAHNEVFVLSPHKLKFIN